MRKSKARRLKTVGFVIAIATISLLALTFSAPKPATAFSAKVLRIEKGYTAGDVASLLRAEGLIRNRLVFQIYLRVSGADRKLKAGTYKIVQGTSLPSLVAALTQGKTLQIQVTIPEGSTARAIARILDKAGICGQEDFLAAVGNSALTARAGIPGATFEGFLFPDTYLFSENSDAEMIALAMAQTFFRKLGKILPGRKPDDKRLYEAVILASIVEREYGVEEEAGLIASVFKNRLAIDMALQSCATVVYIITEKQRKPHPKVVHYVDLEIDDPYNTYIHRGLPPGPISNPGETSLRAVFNSPESDYLYFRLIEDSEGLHKFSKTFQEHTGEAIPVKGF
ncbi:MAG TPA: endolytic transglycosylase MltG [Rectinemataceae bacterium]|nr:endolytic transglycosylase MltG [Rectinemataceae bacterium]